MFWAFFLGCLSVFCLPFLLLGCCLAFARPTLARVEDSNGKAGEEPGATGVAMRGFSKSRGSSLDLFLFLGQSVVFGSLLVGFIFSGWF